MLDPLLIYVGSDLPRIRCVAESIHNDSTGIGLVGALWYVYGEIVKELGANMYAAASCGLNASLGTSTDLASVFDASGRWITANYSLTLATNLTATSTTFMAFQLESH